MPWVSRDINDNLSFTPIFRAEYVLFQGFPQMSSDLGCLNLARRRTESYLKLWEDSAQGFSWWGCLWNLKIFLPVPSPVLQRMPPISCLDNVFLDAFLDMKSRVPGLHLSSVNSLPLGRKPNPLTGLNISLLSPIILSFPVAFIYPPSCGYTQYPQFPDHKEFQQYDTGNFLALPILGLGSSFLRTLTLPYSFCTGTFIVAAAVFLFP